jgi:hypothetical protein
MPTEDDEFAVKVTADVSNAGKAFNDLLGIIDGAAAKAGTALSVFDAALSQGSGGLLQMAASMHPVGRTVAGLVEVLDGAVSAGRQLAETFGAGDSFRTFESSLEDLKAAVSTTFDHILSQSTHADAAGSAFARLGELATATVRRLQAAIESLKPAEERSTSAIETEIARLATRLQSLRAMLEREETAAGDTARWWNRYMPRPEPLAQLKGDVDEVEAEIARLRGIMESRAPAEFSIVAEEAMQAVRQQTRELEIQAATFGMATAEVTRYRTELELLEHFSDEDGPRAGRCSTPAGPRSSGSSRRGRAWRKSWRRCRTPSAPASAKRRYSRPRRRPLSKSGRSPWLSEGQLARWRACGWRHAS